MRALASISSMLSAICLPFMHDCAVETVSLESCVAGMLYSEEVILLSVFDSEIGRVSLGCRV